MKYAVVHGRTDGHLYIRPLNSDHNGLWVEASPVVRLPEDAGDEELGFAVKRALETSHAAEPTIDLADRVDPDLYSLAHVKSRRAFDTGTRRVGVRLVGGTLTILPHLKTRWGLASTREVQLDEELTTDARLGQLVRIGLERAWPQGTPTA